MTERAAIIKGVRIGSDDHGGAGLMFSTYISESSAASQFLDWETAGQICATVPDVRELEGKPCWVEVDGNLIKFLRLWRP
jgi:hypothetical protein